MAAALAFALLALAPVSQSQASYAVLDSFGAPNGEGAGQLGSYVADVAVNRSGAGGAAAGDVYVADTGNRRIQQFDSEGNPIRVFGWDVVASGPDNVTPASAVQSVSVPASVSGGTFTLTFNGKTTTPLAFNATAAEVEAALGELGSIGKSDYNSSKPNVAVSGGPGASAPYSISFRADLAQTPVPLFSADSSNLVGGSVSVSMTTPGVSGFEVCDVEAHPTDVCQAGDPYDDGKPLTAAGQLFEPAGIAIDQTTGTVYVSGRENRIEAFSATGAVEGAFGWGVIDGSRELQLCTAPCLPGFGGRTSGGVFIDGGGAGQISSEFGVGKLDVGPSGILYVASRTNNRIDEFEPTFSGGALTGMKFLRAFGWDVVESGPDNVPAVTARQLLTIPPSVTGGTFKLSFEGSTSADLAYNVAQKGLFGAVNNLASVKAVEQAFVEVEAKGPGEWEFIFRGPLEDMPLSQIVVDSAKLAGGAASITVLAEGVSPYEVCDVVAHPGELCQQGRGGGHDGQFGDGRALDVAVDSSGTVYALDSGTDGCARLKFGCRVQKFGTDGAYHGQVAPSVVAGESNNSPFVPADNAPLGIAVDRETDHLLVAKRNASKTSYKILELDGEGNLLSTSPVGSAIPHSEFGAIGIAAGPAGRLYATAKDPDGTAIWVLGPAPAPTAMIEPVSAIGATSATFNGTVTPPAPGLAGGYGTFYHFEYSLDGSTWTRVPAEDDVAVGDGTGSGDPDECPLEDPPSCNVSQTVDGLQPAATYQVRLVASTGTAFTTAPVQFTTDPAPPTISGTVAEEVLQDSATLSARLNPNNEETTYRFEWGTTTAYGNEAPAGGASAGSGGEALEVTAPIAGLEPHTAYHFRLVASNGSGTSEGPDQEFFTLNAAGLPENRGAELVSPPNKGALGRVAAILTAQLDFQAAEDGDSFYYPVLNGLPDSTAGGELRYLGRRSPSGWASTQVTAPALIPPLDANSFTSEIKYFSPDLGCGLLVSPQPLSADTPAADVELGVTNIYRFNADGTYTLITNTVPINPTAVGRYEIGGMSRDCETVYFATEAYKFLPGASGLYEWREGALADAGVLPNGEAAKDAEVGVASSGIGNVAKNAVSEDGSRLFFTATSNEGADKGKKALFVRIDGSETVDVSQSQTATAPTGARYELASSDGSHVFFAANYGLTLSSSSGPTATCFGVALTAVSACDLYHFDTETRTLTNLSADANPADTMGAAVAGVLDVSNDGSTVYFAAFGQLIPGEGKSFEKNVAGGFVNLYRSHEGTLSFVATVARQDLTEGVLARDRGNYGNWTSQSTPDGRHLLFVSRANLTGYDSGGVLEAYRYSADSGKTVCVSCRLDGQPSLGTPRPHRGIPPETPIASPTHGQPEERYQPRSISEDGRRVFFSSMDDLAPGAASGNQAQNVYEWVGGQVYLLGRDQGGPGGEVEYLDSSASGDDVFIRTTAQLVPQDIDFSYDVYDLRVGGGFPAPPPPPDPCVPAADECQGQLTPPPGASPPASAGFAGPGNAAPRRSCKRGKRLRKGRCVRRARHHRKARHNRRAGRSR